MRSWPRRLIAALNSRIVYYFCPNITPRRLQPKRCPTQTPCPARTLYRPMPRQACLRPLIHCLLRRFLGRSSPALSCRPRGPCAWGKWPATKALWPHLHVYPRIGKIWRKIASSSKRCGYGHQCGTLAFCKCVGASAHPCPRRLKPSMRACCNVSMEKKPASKRGAKRGLEVSLAISQGSILRKFRGSTSSVKLSAICSKK